MPNAWDADVEITPDLVQHLLNSQFPELETTQIQFIGEGWDNAAYLINNESVFRFPRRNVAVELIEHEIRILPILAPHLPLPIPAPTYIGSPNETYPYPFSGYKFMPGKGLWAMEWTDKQRAATAKPVAQFLRALHNVEVTADHLQWAPRDQFQRSNLQRRTEGAISRLANTNTTLDKGQIIQVMQDLNQAKPAQEITWVHGDLHPTHLLATEDHQIRGVIDWGDVHLGDPATDLFFAYSFLPKQAREEFKREYGNPDPELWRRAKFQSLHYGTLFVHYAQETGDDMIKNAAENSIRLTLGDSRS